MRGTVLVSGAAVLLAATPAGAQQQPLRIAVSEPDGALSAYGTERLYDLSGLVYDTLLLRDADGRAKPWLAREVRREGPRRIRIALHLARWHDGRPVRAADVAFTFAFLRRRPHPRYTGQLRDLRDVRVTGERTLVLTLRRPSRGFEDAPLADVPIMPRHLWRDLPAGRLSPPGPPIGSGPYRLVGRRADGGYRFAADRRFWGPRPAVARIDVVVEPDGRELPGALRDRDVDAAPVAGRANVTALRGLGTVRLALGEDFRLTALVFDTSRPPFDRRAARQAVARALDRVALVNVAGGRDLARAADRGFVHPASPWAVDAPVGRGDLAAARIAFAELGIPPFRIVLAGDDAGATPVAEAVVRQLREAGARVGLRSLRRAQARPPRGPGAAIVRLPALASDDPAYLGTLLGPGGPLTTGRGDARLGELVAALGEAPTVEARRGAVARLVRHVARDATVVPLVFGGGTYAVRRAAYNGWVAVPGTGIINKRSFLTGARRSPEAGAIRSPVDEAGRDARSLVPLIAVLTGLIALAVVARVALASRRRR